MSDNKKILVIDDEKDTVTYLTTLLEDNGYDTICAYDGEEGLEKTRAEMPDLILLDITMPVKSGSGFYKVVRQDDALKGIPVVMVTGVAKEFERFISTRRKVPAPDGYISKPFDKAVLLETVAKILNAN